MNEEKCLKWQKSSTKVLISALISNIMIMKKSGKNGKNLQ